MHLPSIIPAVSSDMLASSCILSPESSPLSLTPDVPGPTSASSLLSPYSILVALRNKVNKLPKTVPVAQKTHLLALYSRSPEELTRNIQNDMDIWETWDPKLNVLLPHNIDDLKQLVVRGKFGLAGLVGFFEHLVHDHKVDEGLLEGKVKQLMDAIDAYVRFLGSFLY